MSETVIQISEKTLSTASLGTNGGIIAVIIKLRALGSGEAYPSFISEFPVFNSLVEFNTKYDGWLVEDATDTKYARYLLRRGCSLRVACAIQGDAATTQDANIIELFKNREYEYSFILDIAGSATAQSSATKFAPVLAEREDVALLLSSQTDTAAATDQAALKASYDAYQYVVDTKTITKNLTQYMCLLAPSTKIATSVLEGSTATGETEVPACLPFADLLSHLFQQKRWWKAAAGVAFGVLPNVVDLYQDFSLTQMHTLQGKNINPIMNKISVGNTVWGNYTLSTVDNTVKDLSVRNLVNYLKSRVYGISQNYMFADNNEATWNDWKNTVEPIVRDIYGAGGIRNYKVVMDRTIMTEEDINNGVLKGQIIIWPTKAITKIYIYFTIDETGVTFE